MADTATERTIDLEGLHDHIRLFGKFDQNLTAIEKNVPVAVRVDGNRIVVAGEPTAVEVALRILEHMLKAAVNGALLTPDDVRLAAQDVALDRDGKHPLETLFQTQRGKEIRARTAGQREFVRSIDENTLTFGIGPAGTGKTFLAVVMAVRALRNRHVSRLILSRPAVEAGEKLGFLPGDLKEKVDPYLRPLYDALAELLDDGVVTKYIERGIIEVAPLAYMRGRTLSDAFVILDEAQNATRDQLKMFLTRLGSGSKMIVQGDVTQIDLPRGASCGLLEAPRLFSGTGDIGIVHFNETDVVRHPLVSKIIRAYASADTSP
ncbi:MAG: PhoH family protein [Candidatus Eremiobacteraeota bacterium]|nr:PhoH family protein [Candidatus Eremiobacteraeota bacterium]